MSTYQKIIRIGGQRALFEAMRLGNGCGADVISCLVRAFERNNLPPEVLLLVGSLTQDQQDEIFSSIALQMVEKTPPSIETVQIDTPEYDVDALFAVGRNTSMSVSMHCMNVSGVRKILCEESDDGSKEATFGIIRFWKDMPFGLTLSTIRSMGYKAPSLRQFCSFGIWLNSTDLMRYHFPKIDGVGRRVIVLPPENTVSPINVVTAVVGNNPDMSPSLYPIDFVATKLGIGLTHSFLAVKKV
ncbi:MAG: hypothetical protein WC631_02520 [Candidatus Paceibacterota bacterium]|jgi:hypothetical protein